MHRRSRSADGSATSELGELRQRGFNRLYQNGKIVEFSSPESLLELDFSQPLFILIDRIVVSRRRGAGCGRAETGYRESGEVVFEVVPRATDDPPECQ